MPPPKKAAKKAAKKHAPHHEAHHHHHHGKDLRRAYEHLGRLEVLRRSQPELVRGSLHVLAGLAQIELAADHPKDAADLLRGAEHLSFATAAAEPANTAKLSPRLAEAVDEQFHELLMRADEHWDEGRHHAGEVAPIYQSCRQSADAAFNSGRYCQALEFARAAEALAHARKHAAHRLASDGAGDSPLTLAF